MVQTEFERVVNKAQEKTEKVRARLLKIKVKAQRAMALAEGKKEIKLRQPEELLNKVDKLALSVEKGKEKEKTFEEFYKEFEKEIDEFSPLEDNVVERPAKKRNVTMKKKVLRDQFAKRRKEKKRRGPQKESEKEVERSEKEGSLSERHVSILFMREKGLYPYKRNMSQFLEAPIRVFR
ncbi:protein MNN4-like [Cucumis melo var. makuwa]|uniref:Protein MNN4-like n=2 Tax=Cucumis melo TaxID=3656 RepID=A0A5A7TGV4_CUCMM|nr:protein MNN4-like [Cucumis melo var. makuwa]TYK16072.1 protein MNN4-like [Cucumis melo var. makuwa]